MSGYFSNFTGSGVGLRLRPLLLGSTRFPISLSSRFAVSSLPRNRPVAVARRTPARTDFSAAIFSRYVFHVTSVNARLRGLVERDRKPLGLLSQTVCVVGTENLPGAALSAPDVRPGCVISRHASRRMELQSARPRPGFRWHVLGAMRVSVAPCAEYRRCHRGSAERPARALKREVRP